MGVCPSEKIKCKKDADCIYAKNKLINIDDSKCLPLSDPTESINIQANGCTIK